MPKVICDTTAIQRYLSPFQAIWRLILLAAGTQNVEHRFIQAVKADGRAKIMVDANSSGGVHCYTETPDSNCVRLLNEVTGGFGTCQQGSL